MSVYKDIKTGLEQAIAYEKENNIKKEKAILVIDMPESCSKCPLFNDFYSDMCCKGLNNRSINYPYPEDFRQDWCPLKPAPEKQLVWHDDDDWVMGYNNCVREIMGSEEDYEF